MPKVPTLSMIAIMSTAEAGVAWTAASGSQRCSGHSGALTAKANMNPAKSALATPGAMTNDPVEIASEMARKSKVPPLNAVPFEVATYNPIRAASMTRPPNRLYSRNFTAALPEAGTRAPNPPIRKYIGISIASKNT